MFLRQVGMRDLSEWKVLPPHTFTDASPQIPPFPGEKNFVRGQSNLVEIRMCQCPGHRPKKRVNEVSINFAKVAKECLDMCFLKKSKVVMTGQKYNE